MKKIANPLPWHKSDFWWWPEGDKKLVQVLEHVADIDYIMQFVDGNRVCVQAGGACGVWPVRFSQLFEFVYTFEPQPDNWECLKENIKGIPNIYPVNAPLSCDEKSYLINNDIHERENWGAGYCIEADEGIQAFTIDFIELAACDLIQLDVEGFEMNALKGATETISQFKPIIVLEEKPLNHVQGDPSEPRKWLETNFGYKLVGNIHRDVILKC